MAHWDATLQTIVHFSPVVVEGYPGWRMVDCGCCAGIKWGGDSPEECRDCGGGGVNFLHVKSGVLADYPGGPLRGRLRAEDAARRVA